jgi:hypothetical protein
MHSQKKHIHTVIVYSCCQGEVISSQSPRVIEREREREKIQQRREDIETAKTHDTNNWIG